MAEERRRQEQLRRRPGRQVVGRRVRAGRRPSGAAARVVAFARRQLGKPYVWGASGPSSYDCSGWS